MECFIDLWKAKIHYPTNFYMIRITDEDLTEPTLPIYKGGLASQRNRASHKSCNLAPSQFPHTDKRIKYQSTHGKSRVCYS